MSNLKCLIYHRGVPLSKVIVKCYIFIIIHNMFFATLDSFSMQKIYNEFLLWSNYHSRKCLNMVIALAKITEILFKCFAIKEKQWIGHVEREKKKSSRNSKKYFSIQRILKYFYNSAKNPTAGSTETAHSWFWSKWQ